MKSVPDELTVEIGIRQLGKATLMATACWSGDPTQGEQILRPLRSFGPPVADAMKIVPLSHLIDRPEPDFGRRLFAEGGVPQSSAVPNGSRWHDYWRGGSLNELSDAAAAQIASAISDAPSGWSICLGHFIHGRVSRISHLESCMPRKADQLTYSSLSDGGIRRLPRLRWAGSTHYAATFEPRDLHQLSKQQQPRGC